MLVLGQDRVWKEQSRCVPGSDVGQVTVERGIRVRGRYMFAGSMNRCLTMAKEASCNFDLMSKREFSMSMSMELINYNMRV